MNCSWRIGANADLQDRIRSLTTGLPTGFCVKEDFGNNSGSVAKKPVNFDYNSFSNYNFMSPGRVGCRMHARMLVKMWRPMPGCVG